MVEIRWTLQAADDFENIIDYIAHDSNTYASLFAIDIVSVIETLKNFPNRGRIVPEIQKEDIREILFGNYRIIYRSRPSVAEVLTIYHGSRLLSPIELGLD